MAPKRSTPPDPPGRARSPAVAPGYPAFLGDLKQCIRTAKVRAALSVNREVLGRYRHIGRSIAQRRRAMGATPYY